jgi:hypothetical protein
MAQQYDLNEDDGSAVHLVFQLLISGTNQTASHAVWLVSTVFESNGWTQVDFRRPSLLHPIRQAPISTSDPIDSMMSSHTAPTSTSLHLPTKTNDLQEKHKFPHRKSRVLSLHGHRTNVKVMINQTKCFCRAIGDELADFIFLDTPLPAAEPMDPVVERIHGQGRSILCVVKRRRYRGSH